MPALTELEKQAAKPLIYCKRSVIAWRQGAKTQTRRLPRPQPMNPRWYLRQQEYDGRWSWWTRLQDGRGCWAANVRQPYAVDDLLWIREALIPNDNWIVVYQSDQTRVRFEGGVETLRWGIPPAKWKRRALPAMFMPRWACRDYARVVSRRPEQLQDISDEDAVAEGTLVGLEFPPWHEGTARNLYFEWWSELHRKPGTRAEDNPMLWRYVLEPVDNA